MATYVSLDDIQKFLDPEIPTDESYISPRTGIAEKLWLDNKYDFIRRLCKYINDHAIEAQNQPTTENTPQMEQPVPPMMNPMMGGMGGYPDFSNLQYDDDEPIVE